MHYRGSLCHERNNQCSITFGTPSNQPSTHKPQLHITSPTTCRLDVAANIEPKVPLPQPIINFGTRKLAGMLLFYLQKHVRVCDVFIRVLCVAHGLHSRVEEMTSSPLPLPPKKKPKHAPTPTHTCIHKCTNMYRPTASDGTLSTTHTHGACGAARFTGTTSSPVCSPSAWTGYVSVCESVWVFVYACV